MLKKLPTLLLTLFLSFSLYSQDSTANTSSEKGKYTLEVQLRPNFNNGSWISGGAIVFRYFPKVNRAWRFTYSPFFSTETDKVAENPDGSGEVGKITYSNTSNTISGAYEFHLGESPKFSPYVGFGASLSFRTNKEVSENSDGYNYIPNYSFESKQNTFGIGAFGIAGFDWYVISSMYIGVQFSVGFSYRTVGDEKVTVTQNDVEENFKFLGSSSFEFSDQFLSGIRLGWRF